MSGSTSNVTSTPGRDRLPFPPSAQQSPSSKRLASSSTASIPSNNAVVPTQTITLDSLLSAHIDDPSPAMAALNQVLSERNSFAAQNAQLWRLIEKQRSGYNQILKELERVRSERDAYRNRSHALGNGEKQRQTSNASRPGDPTGKPSSSREHQSASHGSQPQAQPRSSQDSYSRPPRSTSSPTTSMNAHLTTSRINVTPPDPTLLNQSSQPAPSNNATSTPTSFPPRSDSLPVTTNILSSSPVQLQYRSDETVLPLRIVTSQSAQHSRNVNTPDNSSPAYDTGDDTSDLRIITGTGSEQNSLSNPTAHTCGDSTSYRRDSSPESRISLPDEAKQYLTNMQHSPEADAQSVNQMTSQNRTFDRTLDHTSPAHQHLHHFQSQQQHHHGHSHDALETPMQATEHAVKGKKPSTDFSPRPAKISHSASQADMVRFLREGPSSFPGNSARDELVRTRSDRDEFLDLDDDDGGLEDEIDDDEVSMKKQDTASQSNARAAVEDFPLPPSNPPALVMPMTQAQAPLTSNKDWLETATTIQLSIDPLNSFNSSDQTLSSSSRPLPASFRALPLLSSDLPYTQIKVSHASIRPNDKGKDVSSFIVEVNPGNGKEGWKVEKLFSDVLALDARMRSSVGKGAGKKIGSLPDGKLWRDHAPAKVDQRKAALETYLQTLINLPVKNKDEVIAFFTTDILRDTQKPVSQVGYKEGYLTKRGKNFGGWKTRFFVLQGPVLEYYESRGGTHLGSITITGAQIGRQQKNLDKTGGDDEKEYRHAFLIVEAKKGPGGSHPRHVLCAESDPERDDWVEMLVRYVLGSYNEDPALALGPSPNSTSNDSSAAPRSSTSSNAPDNGILNRRPNARGMQWDEMSKSPYLSTSSSNAKMSSTYIEDSREPSPVKSSDASPIDRHGPSGTHETNLARRALERGQQHQAGVPDSFSLSSSLPSSSSPLDDVNRSLVGTGPRSTSALGDYSSEQKRQDHHIDAPAFLDTIAPIPRVSIQLADHRSSSPEKLEGNAKAKISGPIGGAPIPAGYKFGSKDPSPDSAGPSVAERREKAKSRSFWGFGRPNGAEKSQATFSNRAVFGVSLEESLEVAQIASLPAVVFRCIQYLEVKKADHEEGIYRLSGSSAVIKSLRDRFNSEGDVDLLASDEYWDPHAIAGLLKSFLRELPASILTRDLHLRFLAVIDFVDPQERIKELTQLIASLPITNYSLLRALTAHLILIVQNANVNKMTMRNVGIVFSPTLGIPAGVFSLMLGEFNRVFNVDISDDGPSPEGASDQDDVSDPSKRNSRQYTDAAADQLLGLAGRRLPASTEEPQSDGDDYSIDGSGPETTEGDGIGNSSGRSSPSDSQSDQHLSPNTPTVHMSKASHAAAIRGLNINTSDKGNHHIRIIGIPPSPRHGIQMPPSPLHTPK